MWAIVERLVASVLGARYARRHAQHEPTFHGDRFGTDTVVFVHGLHGHIRNTWGRFPELLEDDSELPKLDILLWGYRATVFPGAQPIRHVGEALMGFVREETEPETELFFVGHSLGGLVILKGLCEEAKEGRARQRPALATRHVHLYASPVSGSAVASAIRMTVGWIPRIKYFIAGHLKELQRGSFCDGLIADVVEHIYRPRIEGGDENRKIEIPIKACVAERDVAVQMSSAKSIFKNPPPLLINGATHFSIKEPESRFDVRYRALQQSLIDRYTPWFHDISRRVLEGDDPIARVLIRQRGWGAAAVRLRGKYPGISEADLANRVEELLALAMLFSKSAPTMRFGRALDYALIELVRRTH